MAVTNEDFIALVNEPYGASVRTQQMINKEVSKTSPTVYHNAVTVVTGSGNNGQAKNIPVILDAYQEILKKNETAKLLLTADAAIVKGAITVGTIVAAPTGVGAVALAGANWIVNESLNQATKALDESAAKEAQTLLSDQLKKATDGPGISLASLQGKSNEEIYDLLQQAEPIFSTDLDNAAPGDRELVKGYMLREIEKTVVTGNLQLQDLALANADEIKKARTDIAKIGQTMVEFSNQTGEELKGINKTLDGIQQDLKGLKDSAQATQKDLRFVQNYLFGQMSVSEQRAALRAGMRSDLTADEQTSLDTQLRLVERRQQVCEQVQGYLNGAGTIIGIASKLGVDPNIIQHAQQGIAVGEAVFAAGTALMSGNLLQAAKSLSGLLGLGGGDPESQRQQEIMDQFKQISKQLQVLDEKMDQMLQLQKDTLKALGTIYDAIVTLSQQIKDAHEEEMQEEHRVQLEVEFVKGLIVDGNGVGPWETFADSRMIAGFDKSTGEFPSYSKMRQHFSAIGSYEIFAPASAALYKLFQFGGPIRKEFSYQAIEESNALAANATIAIWRTGIYEPLVSFVLTHVSDVWAPDPNAFLSLFLLPARRVQTLLGEITVHNVADPDRLTASMQTYFSMALAPTTIRTCVSYLIDMFAYAPLINPTAPSMLFTIEELLQPAIRSRTVNYIHLQKALVAVDIAIAQQALLAGNYLLPLFERCYTVTVPAGDTQAAQKHQARIDELEAILANSAVIRRNWLLYKILAELRASQTELVTFHLASQIPRDDQLLRLACPFSGFDWQWQDTAPPGTSHWTVKVAGKSEPVPTWMELQTGVLNYLPEMDMLLNVRAGLAVELSNFDFLETSQMPPSPSATFSVSLLQAA